MGKTRDGRLPRRQCSRFDDQFPRWLGIQRNFAQISVQSHLFCSFSRSKIIALKKCEKPFRSSPIFRPDLINWRDVRTSQDARQRLHNAFDTAEREYGVPKLLDPRGMYVRGSIFSPVSQSHCGFQTSTYQNQMRSQ